MFCHISKNCSKTFFDKCRKWDSSEIRKIELIWMGEGSEWKKRNSINKKSDLKISSSHSISKETNLVRQSIKNRVNTWRAICAARNFRGHQFWEKGKAQLSTTVLPPAFSLRALSCSLRCGHRVMEPKQEVAV